MNNFKKALPFVLIVLFVASVAIFTVNHGFKYSDYESYIKVDVTGDKDVDTFLDKLKDTAGLIEIDRNNHAAYYQHIEQTSVEETLATIQKDYTEVKTNLQNVYPATSKRDKMLNIAFSLLAISILFVGYSYVVKTRFFNWNLKEYVKYYGFYKLDMLISVGILGGLISLLSLVYKINDYILYSFFFLVFFKTLIFWFKLLNEDINQMKTAYVENFKNDYRKLFTIVFILIALLTVGMGVRSVLPLALFIVALVISVLCDYSVLTFEIPRMGRFKKDKSEIIEVKSKTKTVTQTVESVKQYIPNPKLKKKNKRK